MFISLTMGVLVGVVSSLKPGSLLDRLGTGFSLLGQASPNFFVAILLIVFLSVRLGALPTSDMGGPKYYIMPALSLSWFSIAAIARMSRSAMLDVLDRDHIKLARLNGVPELSIIGRHALKNAAIPILTLFSLQFLFSSLVRLSSRRSLPGPVSASSRSRRSARATTPSSRRSFSSARCS